MIYRTQDEDTICAIATPPGVGGIGVIRVSGKKALEVTRQMAPGVPASPDSHRIFFSQFVNSKSESIDEGVVAFFAEGKSYTGEQTTEISYHGSPSIGRSLLYRLKELGCRFAEAGEFTYRAFINERLDLVQAESVLSLIESKSEESSRHALLNLKGGLSRVVQNIEDSLLGVLANLEANLDFSEENLIIESQEDLKLKLQSALDQIIILKNTYNKGRILREGLRVVIYGEPNVGKSSLLNALLGDDRAIVSERPGTTRDTIEAQANINGVALSFIDTAGVRESEDEIEILGIERSKKEAASADVIIQVLDATNAGLEKFAEMKKISNERFDHYIYVLNKVDLVSRVVQLDGMIPVSAKTGRGIDQLRLAIFAHGDFASDLTGSVAFQARHFELLSNAEKYLTAGVQLINEDASPEFVIAEVQFALSAMMEMLGKRFDDEVMDKVFREFCIGK